MGTTCIYCGKPIGGKPHTVWAGRDREEELSCCSAQCYNDTKRFIEWDRKARIKSYIIIAACIVANLIFIGNEINRWWTYIPIMIIGVCLAIWPLVFVHYHTYERYGIVKTLKYVRCAGVLIALAGVIFTLFS